MDAIRSLLPRVLAKRGLKAQAQAAFVVYKATSWYAEVLPTLATMICVQKLQQRTLVISCSHSIASQECQQLSVRLLEYLRQECPDAHVEALRIQRSSA